MYKLVATPPSRTLEITQFKPQLRCVCVHVQSSVIQNVDVFAACALKDPNGQVVTLSHELAVRYVRRDIRKLSDSQRRAFFSAARVLYDLSTEEGASKYGQDFRSISHFVALHLEASVSPTCAILTEWSSLILPRPTPFKVPNKHHDQLHDGMGFLTQHMSVTNEFERALQIVDPTVSVPYWDFTQVHQFQRACVCLSKLNIWRHAGFFDGGQQGQI